MGVKKSERGCIVCVFHQAADSTCRYNPPVRLPRKFDDTATAGSRVRNETLLWGWPVVNENDWCGQGKK